MLYCLKTLIALDLYFSRKKIKLVYEKENNLIGKYEFYCGKAIVRRGFIIGKNQEDI